MYKVLKSDTLDVRNSPLNRFASMATRMLWCAKGFCDSVAPIGVAFGTMAGIDELRKAKGLEPVFLPFLADTIFPKSETDKIYAEQRELASRLVKNEMENGAMKQELSIINQLADHDIITIEEANDWKNSLSKNNSMVNQDTNSIKNKINYNLQKIREIRNSKK
jgi:hypothetical protein